MFLYRHLDTLIANYQNCRQDLDDSKVTLEELNEGGDLEDRLNAARDVALKRKNLINSVAALKAYLNLSNDQ